MKPYQKIHRCFYKWNRYLLISVGHDIYNQPFQWNLISYTMHAITAMVYFCCFYTIFNYDLLFVLNAITYLCVANEILIKIHAVKYGKQLSGMAAKLVDIYKQNSVGVSAGRYAIFERFAYYSEIIFKVGTLLYSSSVLLYLIYPGYMYLIEHEISTILPLYLPKVDEHSTIGYGLLTILHLSMLIPALVATVGSDFLFILIIINVPALSKAITENINDLNEKLLKEKENATINRYLFRNIILLHKEMQEILNLLAFARLTDTLEYTFLKICLVQVGSGVIATAVLLFMCLTMFFLPAYGLLISFNFQIISFCALGTVVEIANDGVYDSVTTCNWYLLPLREQHMFKFLIHNTQQARALSVGGMAPLNMNTCVAIYKTIYSYVMILYTFVS